eukprot:6179166-Pleurochrysis_carterae.AAC.5
MAGQRRAYLSPSLPHACMGVQVMNALQDVQRSGFSPAAMKKYANDPELMTILKEFQSLM